jgi:uncharacterized membrane protein YphA (DoxX/SURF4 family)
MKAIPNNPWLELAARWFLALTFLYASYSKILNPGQFAKIIYGYGLFPGCIINLMAIIIPWLEFVAALSLMTGIYPRSGALLINVMLVLYMIVLSINLIRGYQFDCGCFSPKSHNSSTPWLLIRDVFYLILGIFILRFKNSRKWCLCGFGRLSELIA